MKNCIINKFKNLIIFSLIFAFILPVNFFLSFKKSNNVNINSVVFADSDNSDSEEFEKLYISSLLSMLGITFKDSSSLGKEFNNIIDFADRMQKPFIDVLKKIGEEADFVDFDDDTYKDIYNFLKTLPKDILNGLSNFANSITDKVDEIHFKNLFKKYAQEHFLRMTFKDTYDLMKLEEMGYLDDYLMFKEYSKFYLAMLELYLNKNGLSEREPVSPEVSSEFFTLQRGDSIYRVYFYSSENVTLTKNGKEGNVIQSSHPLIDSYRFFSDDGYGTYEVYISENPPSLVYDHENNVGSSVSDWGFINLVTYFDTVTGQDGFTFTDNSITLIYHPFKVVEVEDNKITREVNSQLFTYNNYFIYHDYKTFVSNYEDEFKDFVEQLLDKRLSTIENDIGFIKSTVKTINTTTNTIKTNTEKILNTMSLFTFGEDPETIASDLKEKDENGKSLWDKIKDFFKDFGNFFKGIFDFFKDFFTITEEFDLHKINTDGLSNKISFSIFSDISNLFKSFLATPEAPVFSFKLITVPVTIDFNNFAELGKIIRIGSFVFFVFFLVTKFYNKVA